MSVILSSEMTVVATTSDNTTKRARFDCIWFSIYVSISYVLPWAELSELTEVVDPTLDLLSVDPPIPT